MILYNFPNENVLYFTGYHVLTARSTPMLVGQHVKLRTLDYTFRMLVIPYRKDMSNLLTSY